MSKKNTSTLLAIYDLYSYGVTFNIYEFLTGAKIYADKIGCKQIDVLILRRSLTNARIIQPQGSPEYNYRINDILVDSINMFPVVNIYNLKSGPEVIDIIQKYNNIFPINYTYDITENKLNNERYFQQPYIRDFFINANVIPSIAPPPFAFKLVRNIIKNYSHRGIVTITIRNAKHLPTKNSNLKEWKKVADYYDNNGFKVIIIPDIESANDEDKSDILAQVCVGNQAIRCAVYDAAFINLGVNNGAIAPMFYNANSRMLLAKVYTEGTNANKKHFTDVTGITPQSGPWTKVPWHQLIFSTEENSDEIINRAEDLFDKTLKISDVVSRLSNNSIFLDPWEKLDGTILVNNNFNLDSYSNNSSPIERLISNCVNDNSYFGSVKSLIVRALSTYLKKDFSAALGFAKQAILLDGRYADPYLICCLIYINRGNELLANQYLKSSSDLFPIFFILSENRWNLAVDNKIKDILMQK